MVTDYPRTVTLRGTFFFDLFFVFARFLGRTYIILIIRIKQRNEGKESQFFF